MNSSQKIRQKGEKHTTDPRPLLGGISLLLHRYPISPRHGVLAPYSTFFATYGIVENSCNGVLSCATLNCLRDGVKANAVLAADNKDEGVRDLTNDELSSFLGKLASEV
jgi:hypothetical protein